jgi:WD40 repeat protein
VSRGYVIVSLPWDSGFYIFQLAHGKTQPAYVNRVHPQRITAVAACGNLFATGSRDCSLRVWEKDAREVTSLAFELKHRTPIRLIAINDRLKMCLSVGEDGFLLATSTANGRFLRSVELRESDPSLIAISDFGCVAVAFNRRDECLIKVLDQNLVPIGDQRITRKILVWKYVKWGDGGEYLISALESRQLVLFRLPFIEELKLDVETECQIIGIEFIEAPMFVVLTDVNGRLFFARPFSPQ